MATEAALAEKAREELKKAESEQKMSVQRLEDEVANKLSEAKTEVQSTQVGLSIVSVS